MTGHGTGSRIVGGFWNHVGRIGDYPPVGTSDRIVEHGAHDI
jgi:RES domain-containing protein